MIRDFERIVAVGTAGIYESHYLKANSPDGRRGVWLKHTLMRPLSGLAVAEMWAVLFERGSAPVVVRRDVPWAQLELDARRVALRAGSVSLDARSAKGAIADVSWDLTLSGGQSPMSHFRHRWMYTGAFPKKKIGTPAPNLHFSGEISAGARRWRVDDWVGLRGHNWGTEHANSYGYGNCNLWDDGDPTRTVDGFSASVRIGEHTTPFLSSVVGRNPLIRNNALRHLPTRVTVEPGRWAVGWTKLHRGALQLDMRAETNAFVGLRYLHPDGRESYCYNTKFADVAYEVGGQRHTSDSGELELLFPEPLADVPLHPSPGWSQSDGDYTSERPS